jgi:hypothetical protein
MRRRGPGLIRTAARTAVIAGTATAVSGRVSRHQQEKAYEEQLRYEQQNAPQTYVPGPQYIGRVPGEEEADPGDLRNRLPGGRGAMQWPHACSCEARRFGPSFPDGLQARRCSHAESDAEPRGGSACTVPARWTDRG